MKTSISLSIFCFAFLISNLQTYSCTNFLVTKGASVDGSTMISYNADAGGFMEPLYYLPAADHKPEDSVEVYEWDTGKYLGKIKQVPHTYKVVGLMNEFQVSIGETTFGGRSTLTDTSGKARLDYGSLMQIALQRSKTAREAIKTMGALTAEYGYMSSGESMSIADPNEVWIFEIIAKGSNELGAVWVARRVPDGYVCAHANKARISEVPLNDPENCIFAPDVIKFAEKMKFWAPDSGKFSFCDIYCPEEPGELLFCEGRVWSLFRHAAPSMNLSADYWRAVKGAKPYPLWIKPDKKLSVTDVISFMRDHFEGTEYDLSKGFAAGPFNLPYRWKGLVWKLDGDSVNSYGWERPISTQQTCFSFISQMRSWLPNAIGGIHWYGVDDNFQNVYMPLYCCMDKQPKSLASGFVYDFNPDAAIWVFNLVSNLCYTKYSHAIKDVQAVQSELETKFRNFQPAVETAALALYEKDPKMAVSYLSDYSVSQVEQTVSRWKELWREMLMKYNDGYINDVNKNRGRTPKSSFYGQEFLRQCILERPDYYQVKWREPKK
ncbi:MAG: C69 family dipeptidase [Candidatus Kapabacteria bacterium]|nr:C69 family dipeptidase [Candidatus Kapabacteria bacterium]